MPAQHNDPSVDFNRAGNLTTSIPHMDNIDVGCCLESHLSPSSSNSIQDSVMCYNELDVYASVDVDGIAWRTIAPNLLPSEYNSWFISTADIVAVTYFTSNSSKAYALTVHAVVRNKMKPCLWTVGQYVLSSSESKVIVSFASAIEAFVDIQQHRPRSLLVFINPNSGNFGAERIWQEVAKPIFRLANCSCWALQTTHQGHARDAVRGLSPAELAQYDGVVAVGGDGLVQEVVEGLMDGGRSQRLRVGHIPAGSTDALAYTLHGTRDVVTAVLHIALGDGMTLDMGLFAGFGAEPRRFLCQAGYGFLGEVMKISEHLRGFGPIRYDLSGLLSCIRFSTHKLSISYLPASSSTCKALECTYPCAVCASTTRAQHGADYSAHRRSRKHGHMQNDAGAARAGSALSEDHRNSQDRVAASDQREEVTLGGRSKRQEESDGVWEHEEGTYVSLICAVTCVRTDKCKSGLVPHGHLADGIMNLITVSQCSRFEYVRFLLHLALHGLSDLCFPFVRVRPVTAVIARALGHAAPWNVDGELVDASEVLLNVSHGELGVFARGMEV